MDQILPFSLFLQLKYPFMGIVRIQLLSGEPSLK